MNTKSSVNTNSSVSTRRRYVLIYTVLYAMLFGAILMMFHLQGRSLVYHSDAWRQHIRALSYYGKWLRGILYNIFIEHTFSIPAWSFGLGYGGDVLTTLQYYCIGEPLTALSVFVPEEYTWVLFQALMVIRPYLAGLAFAAYAEDLLKHRYGKEPADRMISCSAPRRFLLPVLSGALCYAFCGTVLYIGMLHPYFVTPMIWFPLLLLGIERMLHERRPALLMVITCLAGLSNFYFFYILMMLSALYALFRVFYTISKRNGHHGRPMWKSRILTLLRMLACVLSGTAGAGCILIPILIQYGNNPRSSTAYEVSLFYDADYYRELAENLVSFINHPQYDVELCMAVTAVTALVVLFLIREHRQLKTAAVGCLIMLCFPVFGWAMNGFSYVIDRWTFGAELLISLILVLVWCDVLASRPRFLFDKFPAKLRPHAVSSSVLRKAVHPEDAGGTPGHLKVHEETNPETDKDRAHSRGRKRTESAAWLSPLLTVLTLVSISIHLWDAFWSGGFAGEFVKEQSPEEYAESAAANEATVAAKLGEDGGFYRYTGRELTWNAALNSGTSSTQFCWSLSNGKISEFFEAIGNRDEQNFAYYALDDRIILNALAGVKYYLLPEWSGDYENTHAMYGYVDLGVVKLGDVLTEEGAQESGSAGAAATSGTDASAQASAETDVEEEQDSWESGVTSWHVYENAFALPLGYTYTKIMTESEFYSLSTTERQEALLQSAIVEDDIAQELLASEALDAVTSGELNYYEESMVFTVSCTDGISVAAAGDLTEIDTAAAESTQTPGESADGNTAAGLADVIFHVTQAGAQATLTFDGLGNAETYLALTGMSITGNEAADTLEQYVIRIQGYSGDYEMSDKDLSFHTPSSQYYSGWTDFAVNVGYSSAAKTSIVITFPSAGDYAVQELQVICQPIQEAMSEVAMRLAGALDGADLGENPISYATSEITGTVTEDQTRFLLLNIPYSSGWKAYIDGEETDVYGANVMYMGIVVSAGEHEIRLVYHTPGSAAGNLLSVIGLLAMFLIAWRIRKDRGFYSWWCNPLHVGLFTK